jgi:hypothetical protein
MTNKTFERGGWRYFKGAVKIGRICAEEYFTVRKIGILMGSAVLTTQNKDIDYLMPPDFRVSAEWGEGCREADYDGRGFTSYKAFYGEHDRVINIIIPCDALEYFSWRYAACVVYTMAQGNHEPDTGMGKAVQEMATNKNCRIAVYEALRLACKCQYQFFDKPEHLTKLQRDQRAEALANENTPW